MSHKDLQHSALSAGYDPHKNSLEETTLADALDRWRQGWRGTNRVIIASRNDAAFSEASRAIVEGGGVQLATTPPRDAQGALNEAVTNAEVLVTQGAPLDAEAFAALTRARVVLRPYVGYDDLDIDAATENGILVTNVPDTFIEEVAN